jgi:hypothetical protein
MRAHLLYLIVDTKKLEFLKRVAFKDSAATGLEGIRSTIKTWRAFFLG